MKQFIAILGAVLFLQLPSFSQDLRKSPSYKQKAQELLDSIYKHYGAKGSFLLHENFPFDKEYQATYLSGDHAVRKGNQFSYLWPFSGTLSAQVALFEKNKTKAKRSDIDNQVLPGLASYYDKRAPNGYASYINTAPTSDRFYDDNVWLGIDFTDLYLQTKNKEYLQKAIEIWTFVASGMDDNLGGGIYWCEQRKESKNTCSNAPGTVFLLKLYQASKDKKYLQQAKELYAWTKSNLQDPTDKLYFDNISLSGKLGKAKFPYNTGQMIQAAALLYQITKEKQYLQEAQEVASAAYDYFFHQEAEHFGQRFRLLKNSDIWFIAVMLRGFRELYELDKNPIYLNSFKQNVDYAWAHMRTPEGLFTKDWQVQNQPKRFWLLDQAAMAEMLARLAD